MAPPRIVNLSLDNCPNRKHYFKWLRMMTNHLSEYERVSKLIESTPGLWMDQISRKVLLKYELDMFSSDLILEYVEKIAELEVKSEPSSVLVNKLFNVKFDYKADDACCRLINDLESAACSIVSESCQEEIVRLFFFHLIPVHLKRELCLNQELPSYEKILSFARQQDVQFKHTSYFKKDKTWNPKHDQNKKKFEKKEQAGKESLSNSTSVKKDVRIIKKEITFHQNVSKLDDCANTFAATDCVLGKESFNVKFGLDSCAQVSTITKETFEMLTESTRNSLVNTGNEIIIKGVHDSISYCLGYIDTVISVPVYKLEKVSLRIYVDLLSSMCLLSYNFMKQYRINPMDFVRLEQTSDDLFLGIRMGEKCEAIKEFLLEEDFKILIDPEFEQGDKITVHFDVETDYKPRKYPSIAIPEDIADQVKQVLEKNEKKN